MHTAQAVSSLNNVQAASRHWTRQHGKQLLPFNYVDTSKATTGSVDGRVKSNFKHFKG